MNNDQQSLRDAMLEDLLREIANWKNEGDQIILLMDCNKDIRNRKFKQKLLAAGLTEAITRDNNRPIPTHSRGRTAIDGIFTSHTIHPRASGYLSFCEFPSDHRAIWLDISHENAFGSNSMQTIRPKARKFKSNDPKIWNKFIKDYESYLRQHNAEARLYSLQNSLTLPLEPHLAVQLEEIIQICNEGITTAEAKCRKLRMGSVPFSEEF